MRWRWTFTWTQDHITLNPVGVQAGVKVPHVNKMLFFFCWHDNIPACWIMFWKIWRSGDDQSALTPSSLFLSRFEVGLPVGCEVVFMKVCAEGRKTASSDWMSPSLFTVPCRDAPPRHWSGIHGNCSSHSTVFPLLFILLQILSCWHQLVHEESLTPELPFVFSSLLTSWSVSHSYHWAICRFSFKK